MADAVVLSHTFGGLSSPVPLSYLDANFTDVVSAIGSQNTFSNFLSDTGAVNAYAVTLAAGITGSIADGLTIQVKIANTNTGASTLNYNGTGAKQIRNYGNYAIGGGQLIASSIVQLIYSAAISSWVISSPSGVVLTGPVPGLFNSNQGVNIAPAGYVELALSANQAYSGIAFVSINSAANVNLSTRAVIAFAGKDSTATFTSLHSQNGTSGAFSYTLTVVTASILRVTNTDAVAANIFLTQISGAGG